MDFFQEIQKIHENYPSIPASFHDDSVLNYVFYMTKIDGSYLVTFLNSMVYTSGVKLTTEDLTGHIKSAESYFYELYGFKISEYKKYFREQDNLNEFLYKLNIALKYKWRLEKRSNPGILCFSDNEYILNFHRTIDVAKMRVSHIRDIPYPLVGDYLLSEMESVLIKIRQNRLLEKKRQLEEALEEINRELAKAV